MALSVTGGCLCGAIRYRVTGEPENCCFCHCHSCQRAAGAPLVAWATFPDEGLTLLAGELSYIGSSAKATRGFCGACGSSLTYAHADRPDVFDLSLSTLDDPAAITPEAHIWVANKAPWLELNDGLPQFPQWRSG